MSAVLQATEVVRNVMHARIVSGTGGGPEKTIFASPRFLQGTAYREMALYLHTEGDPGIEVLRKRAEAAGCQFIAAPDYGPFDTGLIERVEKLCRAHDIRIWHGHDYKTNLLGLFLQRRLGLRLVSTVHGWGVQSPKLRFYYTIDRWCLRRYEQVVCVSRDLYEQCLRSGVPKERLTLLENAIDTEEFKRRRPAEIARGDAAPKGRIVVGAVGRLSPEKGFDHLMEAVDRLAAEGADLELWIAGDGPARAALETKRAALRHPERVKLLGFRADTIALFEQFDVYALSSLREGLPQVLLEAMSMEVPVLATRCGGVENVVHHEREGLLCGPGSVDELTTGLRRLVASPGLRGALALGARARIEESFRFSRRMDVMKETYERLG